MYFGNIDMIEEIDDLDGHGSGRKKAIQKRWKTAFGNMLINKGLSLNHSR